MRNLNLLMKAVYHTEKGSGDDTDSSEWWRKFDDIARLDALTAALDTLKVESFLDYRVIEYCFNINDAFDPSSHDFKTTDTGLLPSMVLVGAKLNLRRGNVSQRKQRTLIELRNSVKECLTDPPTAPREEEPTPPQTTT